MASDDMSKKEEKKEEIESRGPPGGPVITTTRISRMIPVRLISGLSITVPINDDSTGHDFRLQLSLHPNLRGFKTNSMIPVFNSQYLTCDAILSKIFPAEFKENETVHLVLKLSSGPQSPWDSTTRLCVHSVGGKLVYDCDVKAQEDACCWSGPGSKYNPVMLAADTFLICWLVDVDPYGPDPSTFSAKNIQLRKLKTAEEREYTVVPSEFRVTWSDEKTICCASLETKNELEHGLYVLSINDPLDVVDGDRIKTLPSPGRSFPGPLQQFFCVVNVLPL